jgi:hypothetical protein
MADPVSGRLWAMFHSGRLRYEQEREAGAEKTGDESAEPPKEDGKD